MTATIIVFIFTVLSYFSAQALNCSDNPCALGGYFSQQRGYDCVQINTQAFCTCPKNEYEIDQPCRVCNRVDPAKNPCIASPAFLACLETDDFGTTFACLCSTPSGPAVTSSADCNLAVTLTSTAVTTSSTIVPITPPSPCFNGGYLIDNSCHCPSGYGGIYCDQKFDAQLCDRIVCQNRGVCAIRNPDGPTKSVCLCRYGTSGDYCELNGTLGFCAPGLCMNSAACKETVIGITRHAYCDCPPGYNGIRCENQYFKCISVGKFIDSFMNEQGKYFECTAVLDGSYRLEQKSCSKGLRFNTSKNTCTY